MFGLLGDSFLGSDVLWLRSFIIAIRQLFEGHCGFHQKMASHKSIFTGRSEAGLSDDVYCSVVGPDVSFVELNHQF